MNRERQSPGRWFFLLAAKERTKENCRCFDAADPRLGGCTPPSPPKRKSEGAGAKRKQYYFSFLTPPPLPLPLSRGFPRTPVVFNGCYNLGRSPQKAPHQGSWPSLRGLKGPDGPYVTTRQRAATRQLPGPFRPASRPPPLMGRLLSRAPPTQKKGPLVKGGWPR